MEKKFKHCAVLRCIVYLIIAVVGITVLFITKDDNSYRTIASCIFGGIISNRIAFWTQLICVAKYYECAVYNLVDGKGIIKLDNHFVNKNRVYMLERCVSGDNVCFVRLMDYYFILKAVS